MRPGVFFDRDGTLIQDRHYLKDPAEVVLLPEAAQAVRRVNYALTPVIVVTNQSGIARGLLTEADYERVRARMDDLLLERNAIVDAHYHCPHHPEFTGACACRKPGTALFERAAAEFAIDLRRSVLFGDRWRDVAPALAFGARGILVPSTETPADEVDRARVELEVAETLVAAVELVFGRSG
jgi:histidinol-phosphate phosphatase family protein